MSRTNKSGKQDGMDGLTTLARQFEQGNAQARAFGVFTDDRELLEDVTAEGLLVTYPKDRVDQKDGGLRFRSVDKTSFACPKCGTSVKAVIL